ncbi:MAG: KilA-N domain-containing protein [Candidatus Cloacimonetes bacterium]|nr:KilA-N domain-containing protein [Candidatus Cloacimonadota bacterium]MBS3768436.1 KilA-N domain-containing protein [Candidatus Cloacimonadota bacterium]
MKKTKKIRVKNTEIEVFRKRNSDYISLTSIARYKNKDRSDYVIQNWMRNKDTIEFLGLWEKINNPSFKSIEFDGFKRQAGSNSFSLTPKKWIDSTNAIGIISKRGRYGGTYAYKDIAFEFASWISAEFKLFLIKEFQRLKEIEIKNKRLDWSLKRNLVAINYRIHTDAIKNHLIPPELDERQINFTYASEADILNIALFGLTAKEWREENPEKEGNIRDYANVNQLVCLSNLEALNAEFIRQGLKQSERLKKLNKAAIVQMKTLLGIKSLDKLDNK